MRLSRRPEPFAFGKDDAVLLGWVGLRAPQCPNRITSLGLFPRSEDKEVKTQFQQQDIVCVPALNRGPGKVLGQVAVQGKAMPQRDTGRLWATDRVFYAAPPLTFFFA
jgi:hypothetical protein